MKQLVFIIGTMFLSAAVFGQNWSYLGSPGFSSGTISYSSVCVNLDDTVYAAFDDGGLSSKLRVMKNVDTSWVDVGAPGISDTTVWTAIIKHNSFGELFVAFMDGVTRKASVKKFTDTGWVNVGLPNFSSKIYHGDMDFAISPNDTLYIAYCDHDDLGRGKVMYFDGTNWTLVGGAVSSSGASFISLAVNSAEVPYMIFQDISAGQKATVKRFTGYWSSVGSPGFSANMVTANSIVIDTLGIPYIAIAEFDTSISTIDYTKTYTYNGSTWVQIGANLYDGTSSAYKVSLDVSVTNELLLAYSYTNIYKYTGTSWAAVGNVVFPYNYNGVTENCFGINSFGKLFMIAKDIAPNLDHAAVRRYCPLNINTQPPSTKIVCKGLSDNISINAAGSGISFQWQKKSGGVFVDITDTVIYSGIHTNTLHFNNPQMSLDNSIYRCHLNSDCNLNIYSAVCTLDVYVTIGVSLAGGTFHAISPLADTYQWLDCNSNYAIIPGAVGAYYTPIFNGSYACAVSKFGCIDTSLCYSISNVGIENVERLFEVFPNPSTGQININAEEKIAYINVINCLGEVAATLPFYENTTGIVDLSFINSGYYFLVPIFLNNQFISAPRKIIINR